MISLYKKIISLLAIGGLAISMASPVLAAGEYDPNDKYFDPSNTYVPPAPETTPVVDPLDNTDNLPTTDQINPSDPSTSNSTESNSDATNTDNDQISTNNSDENQNIASDNSTTSDNTESGGNSSDDSTDDSANNNATDISDNATVDNTANADVNSGNNNSDQNTGNGSVETGDADLVANIITAANTIINGANSFALPFINYFSDLVGNLSFDNNQQANPNNLNLLQIATNLLTGANSSNQSTVDEDNNSTNNLNNSGNIHNGLDLGANTGNNTANENTGDGSIKTGDANIASNVINLLNNSIFASNLWLGMINIFGNWTGDLLLPSFSSNPETNTSSQTASNNKTSDGSTNQAVTDFNNSKDTTIKNNANLISDVNFEANTGNNDSTKNTLDGNVSAGDINIKDNRATIANNTVTGDNWWMIMVNTLSGWTGALIGAPDGTTSFLPFLFGTDSSAQNTQTGADSTNQANTNQNIIDETNLNNDGTVNNDLNLSVNTGRNLATKNTGAGTIQTGDANIMSNLVNFVNNTFSVHNWLFGIVNVFGEWKGNASFGASQNLATESIGAKNYSAPNNQTGADSNNLADIENSQANTLTINNQLNSENITRVSGDTGNNTTNQNTGNGSVGSGNINYSYTEALSGNNTYLTNNNTKESQNSSSAQNSQTGSGSGNNAIIKFFRNLTVVVKNTAEALTDISANFNTGSNQAEENTDDPSIQSGSITVTVNRNEILNTVTIINAKKTEPITPGGDGEENNNDQPATITFDTPSINNTNSTTSLGSLLPLAGAGLGLPLLSSLIIAFYISRRRHSRTN